MGGNRETVTYVRILYWRISRWASTFMMKNGLLCELQGDYDLLCLTLLPEEEKPIGI